MEVKEGYVEVGPPRFGAFDILDYADALIEEYGWNPGDRTGDVVYVQSSEPQGYTLHDAIGEAGKRLVGNKDAHGVRDVASDLVAKHLPEGENDMTFNDKAQSVDEVRQVLRAAMEEAKIGSHD